MPDMRGSKGCGPDCYTPGMENDPEIERLRARIHEIQREADQRNAELESRVAHYENAYERARQWTVDEYLEATWANATGTPWWTLTSIDAQDALMRLVSERDEARAEVARLSVPCPKT